MVGAGEFARQQVFSVSVAFGLQVLVHALLKWLVSSVQANRAIVEIQAVVTAAVINWG